MAKKLLMALVAVMAVAGGIAALSAYEAHVINVTAHIENALSVPTEPIVFGTVFPQEDLNKTFTMGLSTSFLAQERICEVDYKIVQKPKCICSDETKVLCNLGDYAPVDYATHECPTGYRVMADLCQFLSKESADANDISHPSYFIDPTPAAPNSGDEHCAQTTRYQHTASFNPTGWVGWSCPLTEYAVDKGVLVGDAYTYLWQPGATTLGGIVYPNTGTSYVYQPGETGMIIQNDGDENETITYYVDCMPITPDASGVLALKTDTTDLWTIDLKVPPFAGFVAQDWPAGCPVLKGDANGTDLGCDLWIEVTGFTACPK